MEVNASASLSTTTETDRQIKMNLLNDTFRIVVPPDWGEDSTKKGTNTCKENTVGFYNLIIDEANDNKQEKDKKAMKKTNLWK
jgi:hypothetical protein